MIFVNEIGCAGSVLRYEVAIHVGVMGTGPSITGDNLPFAGDVSGSVIQTIGLAGRGLLFNPATIDVIHITRRGKSKSKSQRNYCHPPVAQLRNYFDKLM